MNIFDETLARYAERAARFGCDPARVRLVAGNTIKFYRGTKHDRDALRLGQETEAAWYRSLAAGSPDFSVYGGDQYVAELWACWRVYSRQYLLAMRAPSSLGGRSIVSDLGEIRSVADLGCGAGLTTAGLLELFPGSRVVGTNLPATVQARIAGELAGECGFRVVAGTAEAGRADLVFASEYFEHHAEPVLHLREVLRDVAPRAIIVANAFGAKAIGHFDRYRVDGRDLDGPATSRAFAAELRRGGFRKVETRLWNNRPAYWKKE